eukprot:TRINITY_DN9417_c0_g1_i1.p1 TRINITY_DN9417_c0_g1~~TRINITY_DN9417_c0_g1_i1.p1  ORF type:complete len:286 (-),score=88.20 TRINITY_DN9417_c0_g1_i1:9-866(-)
MNFDFIQLLLPRVSYLISPELINLVDEQFKRHAPAKNAKLWFEYKGKPIKWEYPVGVLFDFARASVGVELPWQVTVHYQGFPEAEIIDFKNEAEVFSHFKNSFKESCFMKYGSVQPASALSEAENQAYWAAANESNLPKFKAFQAIVDRLGKSKRNFPVRVVTSLRGDPTFKVIRRPLVDDSSPPSERTLENGSGVDEDKKVSPDLTLADALKLLIPGVNVKSSEVDARVIVAGIEPPLETPMKWLVENLSNPDRFLYVVLVYNYVEKKENLEIEPIHDESESSL